jgi:hypothetical protein
MTGRDAGVRDGDGLPVRWPGRRRLRDPVPDGFATLDLELGPLRVRLVDLPAPWDPFVGEQLAPFAEPVGRADAREPDLVVRCARAEGTVIPLPPAGGATALEIERAGPSRLTIRSHWQDGWVDLARGEGELTLTARPWDLFVMSLENYLRVALQEALIGREAFLLHAAGVLDGERCVLLAGPSGTGKSTATALSLPRPALSDDLVLVDVAEPAKPRACAVPFYQPDPPGRRHRGCWPVGPVLRLRQAAEDRLEPLTGARAVATLSACVPFAAALGREHEITPLVARLCAARPVHDLHFRRSGAFWNTIAAL